MRPVELCLLTFLNISIKWPLDGRHSLMLGLKQQEVLMVGLRQGRTEVENCSLGQVSYYSNDLKTHVSPFSFYRLL